MSNNDVFKLYPVSWVNKSTHVKDKRYSPVAYPFHQLDPTVRLFAESTLDLSPPLSGPFHRLRDSWYCGPPSFFEDKIVLDAQLYCLSDVVVFKSRLNQRNHLLFNEHILLDSWGSFRRWNQAATLWPNVVGYIAPENKIKIHSFEPDLNLTITNEESVPLLFSLSEEERNLSHFIFDSIPRLVALQHLGPVPLIFGYQITKLQQEILQLLSITNAIVTIPDKTIIMDKAWYATRPEPAWGSTAFVSWLRHKLQLERFKDHSFPKKIFIHRSDSSTRTLLNRMELLQHALDNGYAPFHLTGLPFEMQLKLFINADSIITEQGAGCSLLFAASPGATVFELACDESIIGFGPTPHYWILANTVGLNYHFIEGRLADGSYSIPVQVFNKSIVEVARQN